MKKYVQYYPLVAMFLTCLVFTSCKKREKWDSDAGYSHSTTDNIFKDINKVINAAAADGNISGKMEGSMNNTCATVTLSQALGTFPNTVTVDFGTTGCTDQYGVTRKGVLTAVFTDYLHNPGAHVHVTPSNYYVNGAKVEGTYDLTNTTSLSDSTRTFRDTISNAKVTLPDNTFCTWNATRYSTQTGGFSTLLNIADDEYTGGGHSSGIGFSGNSFDASSSNVVWKLNCRYLVKGIVTIYSGTNPTPVIVDFGNGACDAKYSVSYDIYHIDLYFLY